jgi:sulfate/thiosulfate-binding protein
MKSHAGFLAPALVGLFLAASCNGGSRGANTSGTRLTLAGNSVSRNLYENGLIPAFKAAYAKAHPGYKVEFTESYEGSGAQERAIEAGLKVDVAALSLSPEIDKLADAGLVNKDWVAEPNAGVPATSIVVLVVRKGNPKGIQGFADLTASDMQVILPNPDTSGAAKWNIAAAAVSSVPPTFQKDFSHMNVAETNFVGNFLRSIRANVAAFGKSGKEAQQIFSAGKGDVLVGWESEAMERKAAGDPIDIVYPSTTIQMEPPVAVVTPKHQTTNSAATEFVKYLSSTEAQKIYAQNYYRPRNLQVAKDFSSTFPAIPNLVTIDKLGGWDVVQKKLFGPNGLWDKAAQN